MFYFGQWVPEPALQRRDPAMMMQCAGDGELVLPGQPGLLVPDVTSFTGGENGWREQEVTGFGVQDGDRPGRFVGGHTVTFQAWHLRCWLEQVLRLEVDMGALASMLVVR